ncbi:MAG TPA: glycosyltransferase [Chthonomonadaceae bacterium]|nr:glycosyltransferase [Chthonomonadaceae bacterium]
MDLSVIILSWNTCGLLEKCLRSLACSQPGLEYEVIVVDNASEDDSRAMVRRLFPNVRLLVNPTNVGFSAGNNTAIPHATGRYVLFLNSDTVVLEGALAAMVRYADAHPDIGILGPKLLNADDTLQYSCRRFPNLGTGFFRNTPLGRLFPHNRFALDYLYQNWDHATPRDVDWVSGAALMLRRTLLDQIGGFDEDFFMYCEDVDLCWRTAHTPLPTSPPPTDLTPGPFPSQGGGKEQKPCSPLLPGPSPSKGEGGAEASIAPACAGRQRAAGPTAAGFSLPNKPGRTWRVVYYPDAVIYHLIGKSTDKVPTRMTYEFHRSQYLFYKKHYAASTPLLLRPLIPVGIALRAVGQMTRFRVRYWQRRLRGQEKPKRQTPRGGRS